MLNGLIMASYGYFEGGEIGNMLNYWEQAGFFSYLLPFLLIFAIIFGILSQIGMFRDKENNNNRSINGIIAFVVALMSLQFDFVPVFFSEIFPRMGVGLAILLLVIIFTGLFVDPNSGGMIYTLLGVGAVILIVVLVQTAGAVGWSAGWWWQDNWPMVVGAVFILVILAVIVGTGSDSRRTDSEAPYARAARGR